MDALTVEQLQAKVLYLEQENARLRSAVLDAQVRSGAIALSQPEEAKQDG